MAEPRTAVDTALRALRHRDLSACEVEERLRAKGFAAEDRDSALEMLARTGLLDDARFAESRARQLAARSSGDRAIRYALRAAGVDVDLVEDALAALEPEEERARAIALRRGYGPKTARYLRGKGFSEEAIVTAVADAGDGEIG